MILKVFTTMARPLNSLMIYSQAHEIFQRCIEAVKTMPHYRQGDRKWSKLAKERLTVRQRSVA